MTASQHAPRHTGTASAIAFLLLVLTATAACHRPSVEEVETSAVVPVVVDTAKVGPLQATIAVAGVVTPAPGAEMRVIAPAAARISALPRAEGDRVKAGDLLVRFDIPSLTADVEASRARISQAMARVSAAKANVTRLSSLLDQGVAAPRDLEDARRQQAEAEGDLEQARSAVQAAELLADRAVVRAPFAGIVAQRFHNPGDLVEAAASDPVLTVINPAQMQVVASVPESELPRIAIGGSAQVEQPGLETGEAAKVIAKAPRIDPARAAGDVRLAFVRQTSLTAGMTVQVDIVVEERAEAVIIPRASVINEDGERYVMVAGGDNKAHKQVVILGLSTRTMAEVKRGVKAGDRVIVRGQDGLPEGAAISVEPK